MISGLQGPLQRGPNDFVVLAGDDYVGNRLEVLMSIHADPFDGTGELEWDQATGVMLEFLRHRNTTRGRLEVVTMHMAEQVRRWEPDLVIRKVGYVRRPGSTKTDIEIKWSHKRLGTSGTTKVEAD